MAGAVVAGGLVGDGVGAVVGRGAVVVSGGAVVATGTVATVESGGVVEGAGVARSGNPAATIAAVTNRAVTAMIGSVETGFFDITTTVPARVA